MKINSISTTGQVQGQEQNANIKVAHLLLPQIVELASSTLSGSSSQENHGLTKNAIILLCACARVNRMYRELAFQVRASAHSECDSS